MRVYTFTNENAANGKVKTVIINAEDQGEATRLLIKHLKSLGRDEEYNGFNGPNSITASSEVIHTEYERDKPLQYRTEF
jgi:hypothetical protein